MKTVGIIGGIGPESTIEYYRLIIDAYRKQKQDGSYPSILINSIDLKKILDLIEANELAKTTEYLVAEVRGWHEQGQISGCWLPIRRILCSMKFVASRPFD